MAYKPREIEEIINGRLVVTRPRRSEIEVDVYSGTEKDPAKLIGEWSMPKALGTYGAARTAEGQTKREA